MNEFYPKDHKWCGCPNCGECDCIVCKDSEKVKMAKLGAWTEIRKKEPGFRDRLPTAYQKLLFYANDSIYYGYFTDNACQTWHSIGDFRTFDHEVTHWMEIPERPERTMLRCP